MPDRTRRLRAAPRPHAVLGAIAVSLVALSAAANDYPELFSWPATAEEAGLPAFLGGEALPVPLAPIEIPPNPFLAEQGRNGLHGDTYNSDTFNYPGPLAREPEISSRKVGFLAGTCPTVVFDPQGRVVTVCIGVARVRLFLMDPHSLEVLAEQELPLRAAVREGRFDEILTDSSGGGYFHVDHLGRALIGPANQRIERWEVVEGSDGPRWQLASAHDLSDVLGEGVHLQDALTDYEGRTWFTTSPGIVGYVDERRRRVETFALGEDLQNSLVVEPGGGVYIVTVAALYKLRAARNGRIELSWRQPYRNDGGQGGLLPSGSGTTPTAFGDNDDLIASADNAAGRIHLNVYLRETGEQICEFPLFEEGASATENSPIGYGNDLVIENNAGYPGPFGDPLLTEPGLTRVRVRPDYSGCELVWHTTAFRAQTTPRLSTATGLVYTYSVREGQPVYGIPTHGWYFGALDWDTGERVYEVWVGNGPDWNNVLDPVTLGPDGTAYVGTKNGLMAIRDGAP
jgi:hypothetical protein